MFSRWLVGVCLVSAVEGAPVWVRVVGSNEVVITSISPESLTWEDPSGTAAMAVEHTLDPAAPWQVVLWVTNTQTAPQLQPVEPVPLDTSLIGLGPSTRGDVWAEGRADELPLLANPTPVFFIDRYETTAEQVREHLQWALDHARVSVVSGAVFNATGTPKRLVSLNDRGPLTFTSGVFSVRAGQEQQPMTHISWYGAAFHANLRSERAGLPPAVNLTTWTMDPASAGFRLPSEGEWEKAARASQASARFPWGGTATNLLANIDGTRANYWNSGDLYETTNTGYLTPVGSFTNGVTPTLLHDLAGNVYEWCADWYDYGWPTNELAATQPYGPTNGLTRSIRGGAWCDTPDLLRTAARSGAHPHATLPFIGFRCLRNY